MKFVIYFSKMFTDKRILSSRCKMKEKADEKVGERMRKGTRERERESENKRECQ